MCSWPNRRFSHAEASCRDKRPPRGAGGALPCDDGFQNKGLQRPIMADLKGLAMAMRRLQRGPWRDLAADLPEKRPGQLELVGPWQACPPPAGRAKTWFRRFPNRRRKPCWPPWPWLWPMPSRRAGPAVLAGPGARRLLEQGLHRLQKAERPKHVRAPRVWERKAPDADGAPSALGGALPRRRRG